MFSLMPGKNFAQFLDHSKWVIIILVLDRDLKDKLWLSQVGGGGGVSQSFQAKETVLAKAGRGEMA